jgi:hypothetical protein
LESMKKSRNFQLVIFPDRRSGEKYSKLNFHYLCKLYCYATYINFYVYDQKNTITVVNGASTSSWSRVFCILNTRKSDSNERLRCRKRKCFICESPKLINHNL